eukprot:3819747-Prorocentrum_lima.AAC.1
MRDCPHRCEVAPTDAKLPSPKLTRSRRCVSQFEESGEAELWLLAVVSIAIMIVVIGGTYVYLIPVVRGR